MTEGPIGRGGSGRPLAVLAAAVALGAGLGTAGIYGTGGLARNATGPCAASLDAAQAIDPLVAGEVAALKLATTGLDLSDLAFQRPDGGAATLADWKGRVVLLNLWATWCAPCKHEMPTLDRLQGALGGADFEVVAVDLDTRDPDKARRFLAEVGAKRLAFYADPSLGVFNTLKKRERSYGLPTTVLVGRDGCEIGTMNGPANWDSPEALAVIRKALTAERG